MSDMRSRGTAGGMWAAGVSAFAGIVLATISVFQILEAIAALANDTVFVRGLNYTYEFDVTTWGWIHLIIGLVGLGTAAGILAGQTWGGILGILIASISMISNFLFLPYYPFWAITIIAVDVLIIWALCRHIMGDRE
jgi:hypothetical protein